MSDGGIKNPGWFCDLLSACEEEKTAGNSGLNTRREIRKHRLYEPVRAARLFSEFNRG